MKNEAPKRSDYPIAFRLKKEVIEELERLARVLYPNTKKPNKSKVIVNLIMKNKLEHIERVERENKELKEQLTKIKGVFKDD